jgi:Flp pilus assembly protein TadD
MPAVESAEPPPFPPSDPLEEEFAKHCDRAISALMRKDYVAAMAAFQQARALKPHDATVNANLTRLEALTEKKD